MKATYFSDFDGQEDTILRDIARGIYDGSTFGDYGCDRCAMCRKPVARGDVFFDHATESFFVVGSKCAARLQRMASK